MNLAFTTTSVLINKDTKQHNGSALVDLLGIVTNDLIVRVELQMSGTVNIETGETSVFGNMVGAYVVRNADGQELDMTAAPAAANVTVINGGEILGYDLQAYRTNANRKLRGQLIDVTRYTQRYNVLLRAPISAVHPTVTDSQTDTSDIDALIAATHVRIMNDGITALINTADILREYVDARDFAGVGPDVLGVGRFFVRPTFFTENIDVGAIINSITSAERAADTQAALVNKLRDYAFRMYRDSEYKAAADVKHGGMSPVPTVIIGTDPVIARYLTVSGDLRTIGADFKVRVVSSLDYRMHGKIFMSFTTDGPERNVSPDALNFGNMIWAPELVLTANISRNNTISKETVVQPRYMFISNLPVLTELTITNLPNVTNAQAINFHSV
jgi:hypothetical protein